MAMSLLPFMAAVILTANSGALVPKATMVSPITNAGILSFFATDEAPSTKKSAPLIKLQMKALIARDLWDMNEYYHTINAANESVKKALELLKKPGDLFGR